MASSLEYVQYAAEQMKDAGNIVYKKMFGEYGLWCDGKFFGTVEDDQFYIKITEAATYSFSLSKSGAAAFHNLPAKNTKVLSFLSSESSFFRCLPFA